MLKFAHYMLCIAGICVAIYSLNVESQISSDPSSTYVPSCDLSAWAMSCSKVFKSSYSRILSHWTLVNHGSFLDLSLPQLALIYFGLLLIQPTVIFRSYRFIRVYRWLSYSAVCFNIYLGCILKFVLKELCIVCVSNYIINACLFLTVYYLNKRAGSAHEAARQAKKTS